MEWDDNKKSYICIFYDKDNKDSLYLKYSDYRNKYLNYKKDVAYATYEKNFKYQKNKGCILEDMNFNYVRRLAYYVDPYDIYEEFWEICKRLDEKSIHYKDTGGKFRYYNDKNKKQGECDKLFYIPEINSSNEKKDIYDKWIASKCLSYFISAFD